MRAELKIAGRIGIYLKSHFLKGDCEFIPDLFGFFLLNNPGTRLH